MKLLGKREIGSILKWRGKIRHHFHLQTMKKEAEAETAKKEEEAVQM